MNRISGDSWYKIQNKIYGHNKNVNWNAKYPRITGRVKFFIAAIISEIKFFYEKS